MDAIAAAESFTRDVHYALRSYLRSPGFTAVGLLSLVLGIGATTAMFSVIYGVLISPYPYSKPGEIWAPMLRDLKTSRLQWPGITVDELRELQNLPAIQSAMGTAPDSALLGGDRSPENLTAPRLTPGAFNFLGVPPIAGRTIQPSDIRSNGEPQPVVVISYKLWHRLFGGNPDAVGGKLVLDRVPHTVVGVMPPRFGWYTDDGLWRALGTSTRTSERVVPILRLEPDIRPSVAEEQLQTLYTRLAAINPQRFPKDGSAAILRNYLDMTVASGQMQANLVLLLSVVVFLLLISLCERSQPATCADRRADPRDRCTPFDRRQPHTHSPATTDREHRTGNCRRRARHRPGVRSHKAYCGAAAIVLHAERGTDHPQYACSLVLSGHFDVDGRFVWSRSGVTVQPA